MNFRWSKTFSLAICCLASALSGAIAAKVGPDVAVMQVLVGREKTPRQIVIGLYDSDTPGTVENFKSLIKTNFYRGIRFHRIFPSTMVQSGDPLTREWLFASPRPLKAGTGGPGYNIPAEIGVKPARGTIAMARLPDKINPSKASNGSQFFILLEAAPKLDGQYTIFGEILEGMETLDEISNLPADSNDFPLPKVVIKSITLQPRFSDMARP